jgi:hypothetical protein
VSCFNGKRVDLQRYIDHAAPNYASILDVIMSIHAKLLEGNVCRVGIVLYTREDEDRREQYVLDVSTFHTEIFNSSNRDCEKEEKIIFPPHGQYPRKSTCHPHFIMHKIRR